MRIWTPVVVPAFLVLVLVRTSTPASGEAAEELEHEPVALNVVFGVDPGKGKYDGVIGNPNDSWNLADVGQTSIASLRSSM